MKKSTTAALVIPVYQQKFIFMAKATDAGLQALHFPLDLVKVGEAETDTAKRVLEESLHLAPEQLERLGEIEIEGGKPAHTVVVFLVTKFAHTSLVAGETENNELDFVNSDQLLQMIKRRAISQSITLAALSLFLARNN